MRVLPLLIAGALSAASPVAGAPQQTTRPVFKASVERVTVAATVRDRSGRPVTTLTAADFSLFDAGQKRDITEFSREVAPVGIALLVDMSGSMDVAVKRQAAKEAATQLLSWLVPTEDQVGLYAFDQYLQEVQPLQPAPGDLLRRLATLQPYGKTSLFDAIAETSRRVILTGGPRRAVVVLTDGYDNASKLTAGQVSGIASSIDVPVYVFVVVSPLDRAGGNRSLIDGDLDELRDGPLGNLARWTGGEIIMPVSAADVALATRQLVIDLRHQYLMAFEPGRQPGWHPLELRTRRTDLVVRTRSGYVVPGEAGERQ